jgi:broad specificity phosphatase PhoE
MVEPPDQSAMSLFILTRHAQSTLNLEERVNGDPKVHVELTEEGVRQARRLQLQLAQLPIDLCVHTRFARTRQTAAIVLEGRAVPLCEEPLLDDIDVGLLEGRSYAQYRAWKRMHSRGDPFPGGESLDRAAARYARAFAKLALLSSDVVLVVCHEIPLRYALNVTAGSGSLEAPVHNVPNATPFLFKSAAIKGAAQAIAMARS